MPRVSSSPQSQSPRDPSPLTRWAASLLMAAALFTLATIVVWVTQGQRSSIGWTLAGCGGLCLLGWFIGRRAARGGAVADNSARGRRLMGANAVLSVALLWLALGAANLIAARHHKSFDLTANSINSLSEPTRQVLEKLPSAARLTYIWIGSGNRPDGNAGATAQALLSAYSNASSKLQIDYVNAAFNPSQAQTLTPNFQNQLLLVVQLGKSRRELAVIDEANITGALNSLIDPTPRTLYFLSGHGEWTPETGGEVTLRTLTQQLRLQNYTLKTLPRWDEKSGPPADATALLVIAPRSDLSPEEEKSLQRYLSSRGRLVLMLQASFGRLPPRWSAILHRLGYELLPGVAIENGRHPRGELGDTTRHVILGGVNGDVLFPLAGPLRAVVRDAAMFPVVPLFESSPQAVAQLPGATSGPRGPFILAGTSQRVGPNGTSRAVVMCSPWPAADTFARQFGNLSFVVAAINWTAGGNELGIVAKKATFNTLSMPDEARRFSVLLSLFLLPIGLLLLGGAVWWKRWKN